MSYASEYQRNRRATDPEYAQRCREQSLAAKRRRKGVCSSCGGTTRYNGKTVAGASMICAYCQRKQQHDKRRWTQATIVRAFTRFHAATGRTPRANEVQGLCESQVGALSGIRIAELEQVAQLGLVLPRPSTVRREFGSWNAAVIAAGLQVSRGGGGTHRRRYA